MKAMLATSHPRWLAALAVLVAWALSTTGAKAQDYMDFYVARVCVGGCEAPGPKQVPEYSSVSLGCKVAVEGKPAENVQVILFLDGAPYKVFQTVPWQPTVDSKWFQPYTPAVLLKTDWIATVAGTHTVLCKIDAAHAFNEVSEKNNTETAKFVVGPLSAKGQPGPKAAMVPGGGLPVVSPTPASKRGRRGSAAGTRLKPLLTPTPTPAGGAGGDSNGQHLIACVADPAAPRAGARCGWNASLFSQEGAWEVGLAAGAWPSSASGRASGMSPWSAARR